MTSKKRELFLAVLLSACVLNHSLEADKVHSRKSLHDVEKDFFSEDNLDNEGSENNRKLEKRIVTWDSSQKQKGFGNTVPTTREPPIQKNLNQQRNGSFDADWFMQFTPGQGHRTQGQLIKPNKNSKWKPARGHNEFNGQGFHSKETDEWYEGISSESTKPRKEKLPSKPADSSNTVAKYDPKTGVQCPTPDSTGVFVYPPDCKFYVTCDNGRAFVQPCAPGTLFSPDSLECDFPDKVKCYGGELADFSSNFDGVSEALISQDSARYESQKEPTCPPGMSGLLPHPSDCTKFLQCANGQTYIMDCGDGTVFNPMLSICDWPQNVPGCEDAVPSEGPGTDDDDEYSNPSVPHTEYDYAGTADFHRSLKPTQGTRRTAKAIECPPDYSGLLPHPETCEKFLQCANGKTYVMNCGPGTVFNPLTTVCDWPYNVPGCVGKNTSPDPSPSYQPTNYGQSNFQGKPNVHPTGSTYTPSGHEQLNSNVRPTHTWNGPGYQGQNNQGGLNAAGSNQDSTWTTHHAQQGGFNTAANNQGSSWNNQQGYNQQGSHQGAAWSPQGYNPQGNQWHNQQGHGAQGNFGIAGSSQGSQWHNQQGHSPQGSFGAAGNSQGSQWHNQQGLSTYPPTGPSLNHQSHNQQGYSRGPVNHWHNQGSGYGSPTGTYPDSQYQGSSHNTQHPPQGSWTHTENQSSGNHEHNHTDQQHHEHQHSHHYNQHYHPHHTHHHPHHHRNPGDFENSTSGQGFPQQGQSGLVHPHHPWQQPENQDSYSSYNHPVQPGYNFNGHGYPYNSQGSSQNQPKPMNFPTDSDASSEEENPSAGPNQGQAWTEPAGRPPTSGPQSGKPIWAPTDRRNHSRTHDKGQYDISDIDVRWSAPETTNPQTGSFKPSTWRGMGPGFEQRPSYPDRGQSGPTIGGPNTVITNDKPYERPTNPNVYNSNNGQWAPNTNPTGAPNRSGLALNPSYNKTNLQPSRFYGNTNGTRGHFITKDVLIDQGHSKTRQQNSGVPQRGDSGVSVGRELSPSEIQYVMVIPSLRRTTTQAPRTNYPDQMNITVETAVLVDQVQPNNESPELLNSEERNREFVYVRTPADTSSPTVSIELEEDWNSSVPIPTNKPRWNRFPKEKKFETNDENQQSTEIEDLNVEVETADENNQWKPQLVFPDKSKSKPKDDKSVIMRVNNKKPNYLSDVELGPFLDDEPPFPVHYSPLIKSSSLVRDSPKPGQHTPLAGQVIRLRGGTVPFEGYVEVQGKQPGWGVVCDSEGEWSLKEAHVVCKQLGYGRGAALAWQGRPKTSQVPSWIAANSVVCTGNETKFQFCKFTHKQECKVEYDAIAVRCLPHRVAHCRNDELAHDGQCYYFGEPTQALNHAEAHDYCHNRGSRLLDIIDQRENDFISEMLLQTQPQADSVMTSGIGFTTLNRTIWMWEDSNVAKFKYTKWWPGWSEDKKSSPFAGTRPVCIIMKKKFPCHDRPENHCKTDYFFWDVEDCATSNKGHSFICERPYDDVGCVYGNGNQYYGNASVSATGRQCLNWSDTQVTRSLMSKVPNKEARDKLKSHNFCRNPNPNKESRPWCFTGPRGEYEYCDIPYCGRILSKKSHLTGSCKPKHFECTPGECIPSPWVCDGEEDCTNGADERKCSSHINFFKKMTKHKLDGYEVEKWLNTPAKTCALRCKEADFTCRSFTHQADGNVCYLSDSNIGMTGALVESSEHDYYEMRDHTLDCDDMFVCANQKCVNKTKVCDGKNDCNDRSDEKICTAENLDYDLRLSGANSSHEGRIEVKILGKWGQVCDDSFDIIDAGVICRELGFSLGALEVRPGGFYGNLDPPEAFMVDQLKCRGNESTLRDCDFEGWGKHNCEPEEAVGVVCKTDVDTCQEGQWKCDNSPMCIPTPFICDEVSDCPDGSDESPQHCDAPFELRLVNGSSHMEGRVEIRHHGIWGTVCDDDFSNATAKVICRSLGFGGPAMVKKDGFFGSGTGPIWLDEVFCYGNETQLYKCEHDHWGRHNCDHNEDAGVICSAGPIPPEYENFGGENPSPGSALPELDVNDLLPTECGKRPEDFDEDDELMFEKVVRSSVAPRGSYPWQASIRVRGHSRSSHWCGAVILSPLHVLTAAHCLEGYNKGTYFVRAGDYNTEPPIVYYKYINQKPQPKEKECILAPPTKTKKSNPTPKPTTTTTTTTEAPKKSKKEKLLEKIIKKMKDKF